jgi:VanZ family protein
MIRGLQRFLPPVVIYAVIFYLSSRPASTFPDILPDIVPHFLEYLVLGFFFIRAVLPESKRSGGAKKVMAKIVISGAILLILAFLDELHQYYVPTRYFQLKDILVDFLGSVTGMGLYLRTRGKGVEG